MTKRQTLLRLVRSLPEEVRHTGATKAVIVQAMTTKLKTLTSVEELQNE